MFGRVASAALLATTILATPAGAATYTLSFSGTVANTVFNQFVAGDQLLLTANLELDPIDNSALPIELIDGDTLDFDVSLDTPFTVPGSPGLQFFGFNLSVEEDESDPFVASNLGSIRFFQGATQVLELGAGCGNCLSAITFQIGAPSFSFDRIIGSTVYSIDRPVFVFGAGISYQVDAVPEPATWALLIAGFGLAGAASRVRRTAVSFA
jgi:hypothetical protein